MTGAASRRSTHDEAIALARHRFHVPRCVGIVGERHAKFSHRRVEAGFEVDDGVRPQARCELLARDEFAGPEQQRLENLNGCSWSLTGWSPRSNSSGLRRRVQPSNFATSRAAPPSMRKS